MDLPLEMLQEVADWLPTFVMRLHLRALCKATLHVLWAQAPPCFVQEKMDHLALGDAGVCAISVALEAPQNSALKELCLSGNYFSDAGAQRLATVLTAPGIKLRRLSLCENSISDKGALALAGALSANSTLEEVDLWGNCLSQDGKQAILAAANCEVFLEAPQQLDADSLGINSKMRAILFDWVSQVHVGLATSAAFNLDSDPQGVLFRTFSHVDAYLACRHVVRGELQLVATACTLVATTAHHKGDRVELSEGLKGWLAFVTDGACTPQEVQEGAEDVRKLLGSKLHQPTLYTFLRRYLRQTGWTEESFSLANFLLELAALDASFLGFRPQAVAAAAAVLCRQYLSQGVSVRHTPQWRSKLQLHAQVDVQLELAPCAAALSRLHAAQCGSGGGAGSSSSSARFVKKKYESPRLHMVAKLKPNPPCDADFFVSYLASAMTP